LRRLIKRRSWENGCWCTVAGPGPAFPFQLIRTACSWCTHPDSLLIVYQITRAHPPYSNPTPAHSFPCQLHLSDSVSDITQLYTWKMLDPRGNRCRTLHSGAGVSRSATLCAMYLMRKKGLGAHAAVLHCRAR